MPRSRCHLPPDPSMFPEIVLLWDWNSHPLQAGRAAEGLRGRRTVGWEPGFVPVLSKRVSFLPFPPQI